MKNETYSAVCDYIAKDPGQLEREMIDAVIGGYLKDFIPEEILEEWSEIPEYLRAAILMEAHAIDSQQQQAWADLGEDA